jgi:hypothetical protein
VKELYLTNYHMSRPTEFTAFENAVRRHIEWCRVPYKELAEQTGVHVNQIGRFMRGERGLTSWSLGRIFDYLGMTVGRPTMQWDIPANLAGRPKNAIRKTSSDGSLVCDFIEPIMEPIEDTAPKRKPGARKSLL